MSGVEVTWTERGYLTDSDGIGGEMWTEVLSCDVCGALVVLRVTELHERWHAQLGQ